MSCSCDIASCLVSSIQRGAGTFPGVVYLDGRQVYMGKWGVAADANYRRFVTDWAAGNITNSSRSNASISLAEIFAKYLAYVESLNRYSCADKSRAQFVTSVILLLYPDTPAESFGPLQLEAVRSYIQRAGVHKNGVSGEYARQYLNKLTNSIRAIFKWAVSRVLIPASTHQLLLYVELLGRKR